MKRQDMVNIVFTFFVGFFSGAYLYVVVFAPAVQQVELAAEADKVEFIVTGEVYGGCERTRSCPSFNIADDGSYRYMYVPSDASVPKLREGTFPLERQRKLHRYATEGILMQASTPIDPGTCASYVDGVDVRYTIELGQQIYILDSCGTDIDKGSPLWQELRSAWDYLQVE